MLDQEHVEEFINCRESCQYFLENYGVIKHPVRGLIPFALYDFQVDTIKDFVNESRIVILKARQMGLSTLCAGYIAWLMTFFRQKDVFIVAIKGDVAKNLVSKVKLFLNKLPDWLTPRVTTDNVFSVQLSNGSKVVASGTTDQAGRSESLSLLVVDEAAHIKKIDEMWTAVQPTLSTGGDVIVLSTPNGVGNWFHKTWEDAVNNINSFDTIRIHWTQHPERDEAWKERTLKDLNYDWRKFAQEHDCDFIGSGKSVVPLDILKWYEDNEVHPPLKKSWFDSKLWIFKDPLPGHNYLVSGDTARGDGEDYSAAHVIDLEDFEQVAEYKGQITPKQFSNLLCTLGNHYNEGMIIPENNSMGWATVQGIIDQNYKNLYYAEKRSHLYVDIRHQKQEYDPLKVIPGFSTTAKTRPLLLNELGSVINKEFVIHSQRTISELKVFVYDKNGRAAAMRSYNDDLVLSLLIGLYVYQTAIRKAGQHKEIYSKMMTNISREEARLEDLMVPKKIQKGVMDPYIHDEAGDLRWLLN